MKEYDASDYHLDYPGLKAGDAEHHRQPGMQASFMFTDDFRDCAGRR
jgi:hypothetical protein